MSGINYSIKLNNCNHADFSHLSTGRQNVFFLYNLNALAYQYDANVRNQKDASLADDSAGGLLGLYGIDVIHGSMGNASKFHHGIFHFQEKRSPGDILEMVHLRAKVTQKPIFSEGPSRIMPHVMRS